MTRRDDIFLYLRPFYPNTYFDITYALAFFAGKPRPRVVWYRDDRPLSTPSWTGTDPGSGLEVQFLNLLSLHPSVWYPFHFLLFSPQVVNNNLTMELTRSDLQTQLTCETSNFDATVLRTSVEIDLKCEFL